MSKNRKKVLLLSLLILLVLIAFDQITKYLAIALLKDQSSFSLIDGVLEFQYLENRGAAFSMLQGQKVFILFIGFISIIAILFCIFKIPDKIKYNKLFYLVSAMVAGAIGNMIDRIRFDYVVDFIYFSLIDFPIFNVADICVTLSVIALIVVVMFVYKEDDFSFLNFKQKKFREFK